MKYTTTLENCGYDQFILKFPKLAVYQIQKRITHPTLKYRLSLALKLRKEELEKDFALFMREAANEASNIDRLDSTKSRDRTASSDSEDEEKSVVGRLPHGSRKNRRKKGRGKGRGHPDQGRDEGNSAKRDSAALRKRQERELPPCLNKDCKLNHYIKDCKNTSDALKEKLIDEYRRHKRARKDAHKSKNPGGQIGSMKGSASSKVENTSLFTGSFLGGAVQFDILADQGADGTVMPHALLDKIVLAEPKTKVTSLEEPISFQNPNRNVAPVTCSKVLQLDVELAVRHGERFILRNLKWLVADEAMPSVAYLGRHFLAAIGLDNRVLLAVARDRFDGMVDVQEALKETGRENEAYARAETSINSLLQGTGLEWGSTFHSSQGEDDDNLDESEVYIDLGEDSEEERDKALQALVQNAKQQGLSARSVERLTTLVQKYKSVFDFGWVKPDQPTSLPCGSEYNPAPSRFE